VHVITVRCKKAAATAANSGNGGNVKKEEVEKIKAGSSLATYVS
jgi:hypothetical protein